MLGLMLVDEFINQCLRMMVDLLKTIAGSAVIGLVVAIFIARIIDRGGK